jgi:hypothetical protein
LGFHVDVIPGDHGSVKVDKDTTTSTYGWTAPIRIHLPVHLQRSDGDRRLITKLPPMTCLVADIAEDVIIGYDYILPLQGGVAKTRTMNCLHICLSEA